MHKTYQRKEAYWFVLTTQNLHWFTGNDEKVKEFTLPLENLKLKDLGVGGVLQTRYKFSICHNQGANVFKEKDSLELSCESQEELETCKASFLRAGVYPEKRAEFFCENDEIRQNSLKFGNDSGDPSLERDVEIIHNLVHTYMKIVAKNCRDLVPKSIMHLIINRTKIFINSELWIQLNSHGNAQDLMEESADEVLKRQEMVKLYDACDEAIRIIRDYMTRQPSQGRSMAGPQLPVRPVPTPTSGGSTSGPPPPFRPGRGAPQGVAARSAPSVPPRPVSIHTTN